MNDTSRTVTLYFIRHGHADHNEAAERFGEYAYWDKLYTNAKLTEKGCLQARNLNYFFKRNNPDIVYSSPLKRCLQTLDYALCDYNGYVYVDDRLSERLGEHPCNKRAYKHEIYNHVDRKLDLTNVSDEINWRNERESNNDIINRGRKWYYDMLETARKDQKIKSVAIFSHYEFLHTMLNNNSLPFKSLIDVIYGIILGSNEKFNVTP
jgi:broad specificity phosphatase PhoE